MFPIGEHAKKKKEPIEGLERIYQVKRSTPLFDRSSLGLRN